MFILRKIINSKSNNAEPMRMPTTAGVAYKFGTLLTQKDGAVTNSAASDIPSFVAAECAAADEKESILCYPIFEEMLFEAPITAGISSAVPGTRFNLSLISGFAVRLGTVSETGAAVLVDAAGAKKSGDKVLVRFVK